MDGDILFLLRDTKEVTNAHGGGRAKWEKDGPADMTNQHGVVKQRAPGRDFPDLNYQRRQLLWRTQGWWGSNRPLVLAQVYSSKSWALKTLSWMMGKRIGKVGKSLFPNTSHLYICKCKPSILVRSLCPALGRLEALGVANETQFPPQTLELYSHVVHEHLSWILADLHTLCTQAWLFTLLSYALMDGDILFLLRDTKEVINNERALPKFSPD